MKAPGNLAILALVGPGAARKARLHRTLRSGFIKESNIRHFVVIYDTLTGPSLVDGLLVSPEKTITLQKHERNGRNPAVLGSMCVGVFQGLRHLAQTQPDVKAVIKMDNDAQAIRPIVQKAIALLEALHYAREGEIFGCSFQAHPFPPEELLRHGYSIINSVTKNGHLDEPALTKVFRAQAA